MTSYKLKLLKQEEYCMLFITARYQVYNYLQALSMQNMSSNEQEMVAVASCCGSVLVSEA